MSEIITYTPIGYVDCEQNFPSELPRQPKFANNIAKIILNSTVQPSLSLQDLEGFSHIWVVFNFHQNTDWKPLVSPPRGKEKRGVFATRSPYRPNSIGLSCVALDHIEGNVVHIRNHDLINKTPILDIKPYIPYSDVQSAASSGWLTNESQFKIEYSELSEQQINWIHKNTQLNLKDAINTQLMFEPLNSAKKRLTTEGTFNYFHHRTWKAEFEVVDNSVVIVKILSNYSHEDLLTKEDKYGDKSIHSDYQNVFNTLPT